MTTGRISYEHANRHHRLICDARLSWRRIKGYVLFFVFATKEELETWPAKKFPGGDDMKRKVAEMQSPTIGVKVGFDSVSK
jgi:hypothetical protein